MSGSRSSFPRLNSVKARCVGVLAGALLIAGLGPVSSAVAAPASMVALGQASTYAVLSGASVGNTVSAPGAPHTMLRGDLGVSANAQPTGFPPGVVTGATQIGSTAAQPHADLVTAYDAVGARTGGTAFAGDLAGATFSPGLYSAAAAVSNTGTLTLDGGNNPNAVFVFQVGGALTMAAGAHVTLINGASASRVFWRVNGAAGIGANAKFAGTIMALDAVAVGAGTEVNGRALALNGAISLDSNEFYSSPPAVTIAGGGTAVTSNTAPTISGTTDVEAPAVVTVTIGGNTLTATPSNGTWSVASPILANGTYPVVASVADAAGNPGSATQQLTVDTVLPVISIDGGASVTTNDPTPTITGTTDAAADTVVRVSVDSQNLTALVQAGGTWNVTPAALTDGTRTVTASVSDPAGNEGTHSQSLTVDTVAPAVTIAGGANALTNDATPSISGTANVAPGTTVTVTLADQTLTGVVQGGGTGP
jgi:Ice-binding-like/Bacterial Ig-like domain